MNQLARQRCITFTSSILLIAGWVSAGGIDVPQQGARSSGQAEAFAAQADDASAIYSNPAGLTQLSGTTITGGGTLFLPSWAHHDNSGNEQGMHLLSLLPHEYIATDFGLKRFRFGLGINNTFGLNEDWGTSGALATLVQRAHLYNISIAPTVAFKINDHLSIGSAMNIYYGQLEEYRSVLLAPPPTPLGNFHFRGQDWALGATPGIMWKIDDHNTVAAVYRSGFKMQYSGKARVGDAGHTVAGPSHAWAAENFPQSATLAYAFRPNERLKLEADVVWTDWDVVKTIVFSSDNPAFNQKIPDNWKSGFEYRGGVQYELTKKWTLRGGYAFGQNAIPSATYSPLVPDSNYHLVSAGVGYTYENWTIDAAYQFIYRERRNINNSIYGAQVDGSWSNYFNELMLTITLKL
jgi:long-chain fatty acid transport protein